MHSSVVCRQGHVMLPCGSMPAAYRYGWVCDCCNQLIPITVQESGTAVVGHHCEICQYDLCCHCGAFMLTYQRQSAGQISLPTCSPSTKCPSGHEMVSIARQPTCYVHGWVCDVCNAEISLVDLHAGALHCSRCRFDMCPRCSGAASSSPAEELAHHPLPLINGRSSALRGASAATTPFVSVRPIDPSRDRAALQEMHEACFPAYFDSRFFNMLERAKRVVGFVAVVRDGESRLIVGFAIGWEVRQRETCAGPDGTDRVLRAGYLASFGVAASHRRCGVGRVLLSEFVSFFFAPHYSLYCQFQQRRSTDEAAMLMSDSSTDASEIDESSPRCRHVFLHCVAEDEALVRFYTERAGFRVTRVLRDFYSFPAPQPTVGGALLPCDRRYDALELVLERPC
jgi:ribosomal protein S18 acetylase RimI-like enzyme